MERRRQGPLVGYVVLSLSLLWIRQDVAAEAVKQTPAAPAATHAAADGGGEGNDAVRPGAPAQAAAEAKPAPPPLTIPELSPSPTPLLQGRLVARFPEGARVEARAHDIMAAPAAAESETRVVYDQGPHRFVLMAEELFGTVDDPLIAVRGRFGTEAFTSEARRLGELQAALFAPVRFDTGDDAVLVQGALVRHPADGAAILVQIYVYPATAERQGEAARELAGRILGSLRAGERALGLQARTVGIGDLNLALPKGWVLVHQPGIDFSIYRLRPLAPLGTTAGGIGIYVGEHPRPLPEGEGIARSPGRLLGQEVAWHTRAEEADGERYVTSETQVRHPVRQELILHVWATAPSDEAARAHREIAGTLSTR